jgi:hypothetical protein
MEKSVMGRRPIGKQTTFRMDDAARRRIEAVLGEKEKFADFVRDAVLRELERRLAAKPKPAGRRSKKSES